MSPTGSASPRASSLSCRDCPMWYGAEDEGWGPCSIKHRRGDVRYLTWGGHACDENYRPPHWGKAERFKGSRSTSKRSAVGYASTTNAGHGRRRATRRRRPGAAMSRRRSKSTS